MTEKVTFQDLKKELEQMDFSKDLAEAEDLMKKADFSDLEKRLQEIDLDFLLQ